jgi:protein TonB
MTIRQLQPPDRYLEPLPTTFLAANESTGWSAGQLLRLIVAPTLVTVLLVGGVYWVRLQVPGGSGGQQQESLMQVHLMPRPDPAAIATAPDSRSVVENFSSPADKSLNDPDPLADQSIVIPKAKARSTAELPPTNLGASAAATGGPPDSAAYRFQQALVRHVARYQRYPNAARSLRLEGKVDTQFSMARDGTLLGVWVKTSSGQVLLDNEAIETIRRAQPMPAIPRELPDRLNIHVQLVFEAS